MVDLTVAVGQMDTSTATILITTLCSTVAGLVMSVLAYMRESRAHRWQQEQAAIERRERLAAAAEVKSHFDSNTNKVTDQIAENTNISVAAFKEANDVNRKIQAIGEMRLNPIAVIESHKKDL